MTPGRRVDFPEETEEDITCSGMSKPALERALRAAEIKVKQLERVHTQKLRTQVDRESGMSEGSMGGERWDGNHAKAKLQPPKVFDGHYTELYNVLNFIHSVEMYLEQCRVDQDEWSAYVLSYLHPSIQAWMDTRFPPRKGLNVLWEELREALLSRWLPDDHAVRLLLRFQRTVQRTTLLEYVERFQQLD
eukprot:3171362-Rhodomonas_salina.2